MTNDNKRRQADLERAIREQRVARNEDDKTTYVAIANLLVIMYRAEGVVACKIHPEAIDGFEDYETANLAPISTSRPRLSISAEI
jgi:hypothetical protein